LTYVVTDGVPADVAALRTPAGSGDLRHLVLLADGDEPDPPEAAGVPITRVRNGLADQVRLGRRRPAGGPDGGPDAPNTPTRLLNDQYELNKLVESLLTWVLPEARSGWGARR
jgi:hypothetical protein